MKKLSLVIAASTLAISGASFANTANQHAGINPDQKQPLQIKPTGTATAAEKNLQAGEKFLAENKTKPGVKSLADGLQYKIIKAGSGKKPSVNDTVTVNYEGKLISGQVFDSSYKRGQPTTFPLTNVIPGWQEALQQMPVGSTWEIFVPPQLAYGSRGAGNAIGPNETLIFKVQLIKIDS